MNRKIAVLLWWLMVIHASGTVTGPVMSFTTQAQCQKAWVGLMKTYQGALTANKAVRNSDPGEAKGSVCIESAQRPAMVKH